MRKHICLFVLFGLLPPVFFASAAGAKGCDTGPLAKKVYRIGIVTDGMTPADQATVHLFKKELSALADSETRFVFPQGMTLSGHNTVKGTRSALERLLKAPEPRLILTLGVISSTESVRMKNLSKPVVAPFVVNFVLDDAMKKTGKRTIKNLVYIDSVYHLDQDIETFKKISSFNQAIIILDEREVAAFPELMDQASKHAAKLGVKLDIVSAGSSAKEVLDAIPQGTQAVLTGALWHMDREQVRLLAKGLIEKGIAGFSMWDPQQVEDGLLACMESQDRADVLARRTAVAVVDILDGQSPETVKVGYVRNTRLAINMATARALQIYPSLLLLTNARLINHDRHDIKRRLNIKKAVDEAVQANLRLLSAKTYVKAGEHAVREAMADLLPRVDVSTGARAIDQDRAKAGSGMTPERAWTGTAGGSVLLYSDKKWAKYTAQEHLQEFRERNRDTVRLDVTYDASVAYLNVLRAKTIERIYRDNLRLTRANLERAQIKVTTGAAGPDEVYRWEAKYANDKKELLFKESDTMDAMEALNRVLHRPLQEQFIPEETTLKDPLFIIGDKFYYQLMENPWYMRKFRQFAAKRALDVRPELKGYDAAIKAKDRLRVSAQRQIWLPDFTVEWKVDQYFAEDGHGRRDSHLSPLDDTDWNVGVYARIPLFEGGKKVAEASRLEQEVSRLRINRSAKAEAIIQNVLASLNRTRASYPSITLSRQAAQAARKNLELVTDSYVEGIKTIIDLLDAQNQTLRADLDAANAVYNFLIDFMGVERALGEFVIFMPEPERTAWMQKAYEAIGLKQQVNQVKK